MGALKRFWAVLNARNKEFYRDHGSLGWNFLFPVIVVFGFAFAFSGGNEEVFKVARHGAAASKEFVETKHVRFVEVEDLERAIEKLKRHQYDLVLSGERYWVNASSSKGYLAEKVLKGSGGASFAKQTVEGREIRYVDWLIPGLLAMNMMWSALYGVGYSIVRYRKNGVLKRLKATPLRAYEFLLAQVFSRLLLNVFVTVLVFIGTDYFLDFVMIGSHLDLFVVLVVGAMCLISIGLLVAARIASEELAEGMLTLISWPMMFLSGVWFSLEGLHPSIQKASKVFPLTHMIDAARAIMTDGATLSGVAPQLGIMAALTVAFVAVGSLMFKWE